MAQPSSISSFDSARLARAVGLTLALVVLVELGLAFVPENVMIRTMRWMRARLGHDAPASVQLHGDSVAQGALLASEVQKWLPPGTSVFNAALQGSGPEFTYFLFKRQVESGRVPGAIVIAHSPHTLTTNRMGVLVGGFLALGELGEAFQHGHHFFDTLYGVLCRLSFTLRHRDELGDLVRGRRAAVATWNLPIPTEAWVREEGQRAEERFATERRHDPETMHPVYRSPFEVDPAEREFLGRTLALARAKGVRVFWLTLPEHERVAAEREKVGFPQAYYAFVDSLAGRGEITVLRRDFEVLPGDEFTDFTHLRLPAALRLSEDVGKRLAERLH